jgi:hypothetical protein
MSKPTPVFRCSWPVVHTALPFVNSTDKNGEKAYILRHCGRERPMSRKSYFSILFLPFSLAMNDRLLVPWPNVITDSLLESQGFISDIYKLHSSHFIEVEGYWKSLDGSDLDDLTEYAKVTFLLTKISVRPDRFMYFPATRHVMSQSDNKLNFMLVVDSGTNTTIQTDFTYINKKQTEMVSSSSSSSSSSSLSLSSSSSSSPSSSSVFLDHQMINIFKLRELLYFVCDGSIKALSAIQPICDELCMKPKGEDMKEEEAEARKWRQTTMTQLYPLLKKIKVGYEPEQQLYKPT